MKRQLSIPEKHQLRIARKTLTYSDVGSMIMGGPTKKRSCRNYLSTNRKKS